MKLGSTGPVARRQALKALLGACSLMANASAVSQSSSSSVLLVVNQGDSSVSVVDPKRNETVATIAENVPSMVGHEIATSPDGRRAYLPLYGDTGVGKPGVDGRFLLVIDIASRKVVQRLDFGQGVRPHDALYETSQKLLYVTTEIAKSVTLIDPATLRVVGSIPTDQEQSHMLAISHDGKRGYTANVGPGTVSVLDLASRKFVRSIPISSMTQRISLSSDDTKVFTADQAAPRLAVIDAKTNEISRWIPLPSIGYGTAATNDGRWLLVTLPSAGQLAVVDLQSLKIVHTFEVGPRPQEVLIRPDGAMAYVSCFGASHVTVIDLKTWQKVKQIEVGLHADGMAWAGP